MGNLVGVFELLHPAGAPGGVCIVGGRSHHWLVGDREAAAGADVVLLDASAKRPHELARAAAAARGSTGIVVVAGSWPVRRRAVDALAALGLAPARSGLAARQTGTARCILVLGRSSHVMGPIADRMLVRLAGGLQAARSATGLTLCAPAPPEPLAPWLDGSPEAAIVARTSWRGNNESAILFRVRGRIPEVVAKVGLGQTTFHVGDREADAAANLGPHARDAGARTPELVRTTVVAGRTAALLSALAGKPLAQASRHAVRRSAQPVVEWLGRFVARTATNAPALPVVAEAVLDPAREVVSNLDGGSAYVERLEALARDTGERTLTVAAAHGDLTLWNVLDGAQPGIVDWEGARRIAPPLSDLPYLLVDIDRHWARRRERVDAFRRCFPESRPVLDAVEGRRLTGLELPSSLLELAFHACWLGHAADERRRGVHGPFREIVGVLVRRAIHD